MPSSLGNNARSSILIVDDEQPVRELMQVILATAGHPATGAADLKSAREMLASQPVSLVFCDIGLGLAESGTVLLHELAPRSPDIAVVMMTGNHDIQTAIDCLRNGAFDYLLKPFSAPELRSVISRVFERQQKMIAERNRVEEQIRILGKFSSENPNPVLRVSKDGTLLYANQASAALLDEFSVKVGDRVPARLLSFIDSVIKREKGSDFEVEGTGRVFLFAVTPIAEADYVYLYGHDITAMKAVELELIRVKDQAQELALHDPLTGLPNRLLLEDRLHQAVAYAERNNRKFAVGFIDLDNFKQINDSQGHKMGDLVLTEAANAFSHALRKTDTIARWGGDEMLILLSDLHSREEARMVCERLKSQVQTKLAGSHLPFPVRFSMGIAVYPDDSASPETLLQQADTALYLAKNTGRDRCVLFSETEKTSFFRRQANLKTLLNHAISNGQIEAYFQPIVSASTGRVAGAEALARWFDPGEGSISPATFIPMAEEMGLIYDLGKLVLRKSLFALREWRQLGFSFPVSCNVSIRQLFRAEFLEELTALTNELNVAPSDLVLEITESQALQGMASESRLLQETAERGFTLSIDDFGQGYSSLSSLYLMPVSELKLDMKFVRNLQSEKGRLIVEAIVQLAKTLRLETVAEGVEDKDAVAILNKMRIDRLQGYLFSKPLSPTGFKEFLGKESSASAGR